MHSIAHVSAMYGHLKVAKYLVGKADVKNAPDENRNTALKYAAWRVYADIVRHLTAVGNADLNATTKRGLTAKYRASSLHGGERTSVVEYLIKSRDVVDEN
mmetsp:Transcript_2890/g.8108  ORF Transcript_2890/g.8108 Transcript_2890/m.8108 type:complete len:101 (-) Transcript_2890:44-346(-)